MLTPATLRLGLLEFHQLDRMVRTGREAAGAVLDGAGGEWLAGRVAAAEAGFDDGPVMPPEPRRVPAPLA